MLSPYDELPVHQTGAVPYKVRGAVADAVERVPALQYPVLAELREDAVRLRAALVSVIEAVPDAADPIREAARRYVHHQLAREQVWQQDAFTGPRR